MKDFIILDMYSNFVETTDYKGLKKLLIDEIERDTLTTLDMIDESNKDIIVNNFKMMRKLATEDYTDVKYLIDELEPFGWNIIDYVKYKETKRLVEQASKELEEQNNDK